jgi:hypothetical protein
MKYFNHLKWQGRKGHVLIGIQIPVCGKPVQRRSFSALGDWSCCSMYQSLAGLAECLGCPLFWALFRSAFGWA